MSASPSFRQALTAATHQLEPTSPSARSDAQSLLCHVLNCNSAHLAAWPEKILSAQQAQQYKDLIEQRASGTPVAYLTGRREFWSLELAVTPATLIPRPETETLVEFILERFSDSTPLQLVDLGTGSGAIAIAIASERPHWSITATDVSADALAVARANAARHGLNNIDFRMSHWFDALEHPGFDIIVSNPPYVASHDPHLLCGDVKHEPSTALVSGVTGLNDIKRITDQARQHLNAGGWLILEHGYDQKQAVRHCFESAGFEPVVQKNDYSKQPRMTAGCILTN